MGSSPIITDLHFEILGVSRTSSKDEIKKAFRSQQKLWHPDRNPDKLIEATERSKKINDAYDVLKDYEPIRVHSAPQTKPSAQPKQGVRPKGVKLNIERTRVKSSNIHSMGYDPAMKVLQVEFFSGGIYQYYEVPAFIYFEMMGAPSKGKYLNRIILGKYRYEGF